MILNVTYPNSNLLKPTKKDSCKLYRPRANAADNCAGSPNELAISLDKHTIYPRSVYKKKPCRDKRGKGLKKNPLISMADRVYYSERESCRDIRGSTRGRNLACRLLSQYACQ